MTNRGKLLGAAMLCGLATACATRADEQALRRPVLPPRYVALVDRGASLRESVAIYEINGAPEYHLFDGNGIITTRPTRAEINGMMRHWLRGAGMLAPDIRHAHYLLSITFEELHGGDVVPFSDKVASARVHYVLNDARTGERLFDQTFEASLQARMPGVTQEMVRAAIASGIIGALIAPEVRDASDPAASAEGAGGILGADSAAWASEHETTVWDWPEAVIEAAPRVVEGLGIGLAGATLANNVDASTSDPAARWTGGAIGAGIGFLAAAPTGRPPEHWDSAQTAGAFGGTERRHQAVRGMMEQNFDRFLFGLDQQGLLHIRRAVTCDELNPGGISVAFITETSDSVAYDCPITGRRH